MSNKKAVKGKTGRTTEKKMGFKVLRRTAMNSAKRKEGRKEQPPSGSWGISRGRYKNGSGK